MTHEAFPETEQHEIAMRYIAETARGLVWVAATQVSTRGNGCVELTDGAFGREAVDFTGAADHLSIHQGRAIAGSQFNHLLFPNTRSIISLLEEVMPASMRFDRYGMVELTLEVISPGREVLGYSGVMKVAALEEAGIEVTKGIRMPGGDPAEEDGIPGAWYPDGRFVPKANIAVATLAILETAETNKVSVIIERDAEQRPVVLTAHPGEVAPPFPIKTASEAFSKISLDYWVEHAFVIFTESSTPDTVQQ